MRALVAAQIAAMRRNDWASAFAMASPDLQAQYGNAAAFSADVIAHYAPLPAVRELRFLDVVTFRGLPTYRVAIAGGDGQSAVAYYLIRRLDDGSLRIAGCVLARAVPGS